MKNIIILGSTGSVGASALKVIAAYPDRYNVVGLAAGGNLDLLFDQINRFQPKAVAIRNKEGIDALNARLKGRASPELYCGPDGYATLATLEQADTVISAISGAAGLLPTYAAIQAGKNIALANKETMVMAGALVINLAKSKSVDLLPVDSEHSAVFQSLQGHPREDLQRIVLTASGGPFRNFTPEEMASVTPVQALNHPNWNMGPKITIDSATLMNKGLEVIEAKWLFDLRLDQIDIMIHPQSIVHSMVEYGDGSIIAQMGVPDMITPIAYALSYPRHWPTPARRLDLEAIGTLTFDKPDFKKFRCLQLAFDAMKQGGSMPAVLNAANEVAVNAFLEGRIPFLRIPAVIEETMQAHRAGDVNRIEDVLEADRWAREKSQKIIKH
ncbi:MAG: 1-deoxy-D-xylulose-5-phosphate reductoisomerase [Desulfobacteraceae bacterium]|nr:MAG: 1-deoxy-D-xylulose-5-phosphate reductoisomerase [Desulfobacteraceae bacterium]